MQAHETLGVRPGAGRREVTEAFRRFALRNHPDRGGDPNTFQAGVDAYRRLTGSSPAPGAARALRPDGPSADVVFHRRTRPRVPALLRLVGQRLAAFRPRPYSRP